MDANRRRFSRVAFETEGRLFLAGGEHTVRILDISLKGALFTPQTPMFIPVGSNCTLKIRLNEAGASIRMEATVVFKMLNHYGLACREIDVDSVTHLRRLIELNLGDARLAERELTRLTHQR